MIPTEPKIRVSAEEDKKARNSCIACSHYNSGFAQCRRFPPVPIFIEVTNYDVYNNLVKHPHLEFRYPDVQPDNQKCGEFSTHVY